jgi:nitrogen fixation-related uncharacterized protein
MTRESIVQLIGVAVFIATVVVTVFAIIHLFAA